MQVKISILLEKMVDVPALTFDEAVAILKNNLKFPNEAVSIVASTENNDVQEFLKIM